MMEQINQIEEIKKLYAMNKTYLIPKEPKKGQEQIKITIRPLEIDEMGMLQPKDDSPEELVKNSKKLLARSLLTTAEVIGPISFAYLTDLMNAIMDANNLSEEDIKKAGVPKLLDKLKKKQDDKATADA